MSTLTTIYTNPDVPAVTASRRIELGSTMPDSPSHVNSIGYLKVIAGCQDSSVDAESKLGLQELLDIKVSGQRDHEHKFERFNNGERFFTSNFGSDFSIITNSDSPNTVAISLSGKPVNLDLSFGKVPDGWAEYKPFIFMHYDHLALAERLVENNVPEMARELKAHIECNPLLAGNMPESLQSFAFRSASTQL